MYIFCFITSHNFTKIQKYAGLIQHIVLVTKETHILKF